MEENGLWHERALLGVLSLSLLKNNEFLVQMSYQSIQLSSKKFLVHTLHMPPRILKHNIYQKWSIIH